MHSDTEVNAHNPCAVAQLPPFKLVKTLLNADVDRLRRGVGPWLAAAVVAGAEECCCREVDSLAALVGTRVVPAATVSNDDEVVAIVSAVMDTPLDVDDCEVLARLVATNGVVGNASENVGNSVVVKVVVVEVNLACV